MTSTSDAVSTCDYVVALGDDALIASQRLSEWVARAPTLEEDVALANIALDLLGQARLLLAYAGELHDPPQSEDDLAYLRPADGMRHAAHLERPSDDYAVTIARLLLFAAYQFELYSALLGSTDPTLSGVAGKAVKEVAYHRDHGRLWTCRLGDGTAISHERMQAAIDVEWPGFCSLFEGGWIPSTELAEGRAVDPASLRSAAFAWVEGVLAAATLDRPDDALAGSLTGPPGRDGVHTEDLDLLLTEMREVTVVHPGASW